MEKLIKIINEPETEARLERKAAEEQRVERKKKNAEREAKEKWWISNETQWTERLYNRKPIPFDSLGAVTWIKHLLNAYKLKGNKFKWEFRLPTGFINLCNFQFERFTFLFGCSPGTSTARRHLSRSLAECTNKVISIIYHFCRNSFPFLVRK